MKKKIAIVTRQIVTGGIEKALISMLEVMPEDDFEVTLFVMARGGEFEQFIPKWVKIKNLYGEESTIKEKVINKIKKLQFISAIKIGLYSIKALKSKPGYEQERVLAKILPKQEEEYDLAIAYHVPASFPVVYVTEHLKAKRKIAWIHSDVEVYKDYMKKYKNYYYKFNKIYCVSKFAQDKFNVQYPELAYKTDVFYNIINAKELYKMAKLNTGFDDNYDGIRILTVGRLSEEKGYDIIPDIIYRLKEERINIKWYIVGEGELRYTLEEKIKDMNLNNNIILLGNKNNPYPFFKECDIYVQPSRHEGYCITLAEARMFKKPIITTNFVGAKEQIINNENGLIVEFDKNQIYEAIKKLIDNSDMREKFINKLKEESEKDKFNIEELYQVIK